MTTADRSGPGDASGTGVLDTLAIPVALVALSVATGGVLEFPIGDETVGVNTTQSATLLVALLAVRRVVHRQVLRLDLVALPITVFVAYVVVQGVGAGVGPFGTGGFGRFATVLLLLLALPQFAIGPPARVPSFPRWDVPVVLMGVVIAVMALARVVPAMGDPDLGFYDLKDVVQLPLGNHNYVAAILVASLAVVLVRPLGRTWWSVAAGVIGLGLVVTLSRGGWLAAGVVLVVLAATRRDRATVRTVAGVGLVALALLVVVVLAGGGATGRLAGVFSPATQARMDLWGASWDAFVANPLLGVGIDRLPEWMTAVRQPYVHAHNLVLHALATTGVVGTAIYLTYWAMVGGRAVRLPERDQRLRVGLPLLALFVHAQIDSLSHFLVYEVVVATLVGVAAAHAGAPLVRELGPGARRLGGTGPSQ